MALKNGIYNKKMCGMAEVALVKHNAMVGGQIAKAYAGLG